MKYIGIDYGSVRIGIALSDDGGTMAFPKEVIASDNKAILNIVTLCKENNVDAVVIGESRDFSGNENVIMKKMESFKEKLAEILDLPIYTHPEFMTSVEASRLQGENEMLDASAAALILRHFLDTKLNLKK